MPSVTLEQAIAATRFGFGARPSDFSAIGSDPKAWLKSQTQPGAASQLPTALPSFSQFTEAVWAGAALSGVTTDGLFDLDLRTRTRFSQQTTMPFRERFVHFWANHLSVANRGELGGAAITFEREVIRPNIMGRFEDLLVASSAHPFMIYYLENFNSAGPNSSVAGMGSVGINENLAREILELHTLGVDGGYTQADVTSFAKVITGWTFSNRNNGARPYGRFYFEPAFHEPGAQTVLGTSYAQTGVDQGLAVLKALAKHPSTIDHVCIKIAQYFHSDSPPASLVDALKSAWTATDGSLSAVANALVDAPEMWAAEQAKVKSADDFWVSMLRAVDAQWPADWIIMWAYIMMGAPPFTAASPAGWPVASTAWAAPGPLRQRIQVTNNLCGGFAPNIPGDLVTFAQGILGPFLKPATVSQIQSAANRNEALAILFLSPEFQRR
ncbi:MAG: DUF1800 domain-containing protein [Alphaproteobacteria bacterium]